MRRLTIITAGFLILGIHSYGQSPSWSVVENDFEYTMSYVAFLNIDGVTLASTNDKIAAFVNGECRGVTNLIYVESKGRYYAYFNVFSNTVGETVNFKVYDSVKDKVTDISTTANFQINELYGNLSQAFSFASPALSNKAELVIFGFRDIPVIYKTVNGNETVLYVASGQDVTALTSDFFVSDGAMLYYEGERLISGTSVIDFSSPITVDIISEDESVLNQWLISVRYTTDTGTMLFYKKDAVCYKGGSIKVTSSQNGNEVILLLNKIAYASLPITNGEVVFTDLAAGNYLVKINGIEKEIEIALKE